MPECSDNVSDTKNLLQDLGFFVNEEKSVCEPTQILDHLGFTLNSILMIVEVAGEKCEKIRAMGHNLLGSRHKLTIRLVAKFIGSVVSCFPGMEYGPLHYRYMERDKKLALKMYMGNYEGHMIL